MNNHLVHTENPSTVIRQRTQQIQRRWSALERRQRAIVSLLRQELLWRRIATSVDTKTATIALSR